MEKLEKFQSAILDFFEEYVKDIKPDNPVKAVIIADKDNHHYQLLRMGFQKDRFVHLVVFHFDIIAGKIWTQVNNTDILVNEYLEKRGVKKDEMVIGFLPDYMRPHTDFAAA